MTSSETEGARTWGAVHFQDLSPTVKHMKKVFPGPKPLEQPNSRRYKIKPQQETVILHNLQQPAMRSNLPPRALCSVPRHATASDRHSCQPQRWTLATSGRHLICRTKMFPLSISILCKQIHSPGVSPGPKNHELPPSLTETATDSKELFMLSAVKAVRGGLFPPPTPAH